MYQDASLQPSKGRKSHVRNRLDSMRLKPLGVFGRALYVWVELNLTDRRLDFCRLEQILNVVLPEVGDSNSSSISFHTLATSDST